MEFATVRALDGYIEQTCNEIDKVICVAKLQILKYTCRLQFLNWIFGISLYVRDCALIIDLSQF